MYKSPIEIMCGDVKMQMEGDILKIVQSYDINVNKEELLNALQYDRNLYQKGYDDGYADGLYKTNSIVLCKDCKHCMLWNKPIGEHIGDCRFRYMYSDYPTFQNVKANDFCSYGERRE